MLEKEIEKYLRVQVNKLGGIAYKFVSPGNVGVPDRLVLLPNGKIIFIELKQLGKKPSKNQNVQIERIKKLGFEVYVLDSKEKINQLLGGGANAIHTP